MTKKYKMKHYDVIIIGGGIIGLSSAYYLGKAGKSVLVLDKGDGIDGCSFGNAGFISPSHFIPLAAPGIISKGLKWMMSSDSPFYIRPRLDVGLMKWGWQFVNHATQKHVDASSRLLADLSLLSRDLHIELADEGNFPLQNKGMLMLCKEEETLAHEMEIGEQSIEMGMDTKVYSAEGLKELEPNVNLDVLGGVLFPMDSYIDPAGFMNNFPTLLKPFDVTIIHNAEVDDFVMSGNEIKGVLVEEEQYICDQVVLATGSFSSQLMKKLKLSLLLEAGKGYSVDFTNPSSVPTMSYILAEARVAVTPFPDKVRLAGTMEIAGLNQEVNKTRANGFLKSVQAYLPDYKFEDLKDLPVWAGLRPCSPDGLPYVGRTKEYRNLTLATGHAMMGFTLGPVTGQLVKEIIMEESTSLNIEKLSANRY